MSRVKLIPFEVVEVMDAASEIPQGVRMIEAPLLWNRAKQGSGNVIAVLDTGCQTTHPDLKGQIAGGRNFTTDYNGDVNNYSDNNGHGTHVSGTIAAVRNSQGVAGVAPEASLLILKVLTGTGYGEVSWLVSAVDYARKWTGPNGEKVRVISMSLGGPVEAPELHEAIQRAVVQDISVVCASGNEGDGRGETNEFAYPGAYSEVIQVGAVDYSLDIATFSNTNNEIDLVAPGVNILSTYLNGQYARLSGTSMATPHVSGALALVINVSEALFQRKLTEAEVFAQLVKRTMALGYSKREEGNGFLALGLQEKLSGLFSVYYTKV